jgi:hypothetical protein
MVEVPTKWDEEADVVDYLRGCCGVERSRKNSWLQTVELADVARP